MSVICPACGGTAWEPLLKLASTRSLTSDQRIVDQPLDKLLCTGCGLGRNRVMLGSAARDADYEHDYTLNVAAGEEHIYFTPKGPLARSQAIFDWIEPYLPAKASSLVEVGCGMGNLLARLARHYPDANILGIEGNRRATELARQRGFTIRRQFVGPNEPELPQADLLVAYGVAEHVEELPGFLAALRTACTPDGRVILCVPVQNAGGYDLFFSDHVWHFTLAHFQAAIVRAGFEIMHSDASSQVVAGFGLVVARPGKPAGWAVRNEGALQITNRDAWQARLCEADRQIASLARSTVAVYGASEVLSLLLAYTRLAQLDIAACLDEDEAKIGTLKHQIQVHHPDNLTMLHVDAVLLTVNPRYHDQIRTRLASTGALVLSAFG